jgi:ribosomal-protein-alanine N-acetyltransferase
MPPRVHLRPPQSPDETELLSLAHASRALHRPWVAPPSTVAGFHAYLARMAEPGNAAFLVCHAESGRVAGVVNVTGMVHGLFCSGYLGYHAFSGSERQGLMCEGVSLVVRRAFRELKLHRLEANIQPGNLASIALARSCGFALEGYSPRYLKIGGRWRDHERWAVLAS